MTPDIGLGNWFGQRARRTPERKALFFEGRNWTYGALLGDIDALAGRLRRQGVGLVCALLSLVSINPLF